MWKNSPEKNTYGWTMVNPEGNQILPHESLGSRELLYFTVVFSFLRLELCETCSFGAPLLVFVLCPGYGEMPLYCSKVCARPLQHSIILGSCDSTKVMLALFCTTVLLYFLGRVRIAMGLSIDHVWLVMTFLCLFLCCFQFNVYLSRVPQECKLISWTEWEKEEHESFVLVLQGLRLNTPTHGILYETISVRKLRACAMYIFVYLCISWYMQCDRMYFCSGVWNSVRSAPHAAQRSVRVRKSANGNVQQQS